MLGELSKDAGDLEQIIEDFCTFQISRIRVFKTIPPVFLYIEALVFNFPSYTTSLVGEFQHVAFLYLKGCYPFEFFTLRCCGTTMFPAFDDLQGMQVMQAIAIGNIVDPTEVLPTLLRRWGGDEEVVLGLKFDQGIEFLVQRREIGIFEDDDELPVEGSAQGKGRATSEEAIEQETERQSGESGRELGCQSIEGFEFTVLFRRSGHGVLDEFGVQGESEALGSDELRLQDGMIIRGGVSLRLGQTVSTMALMEGQGTGPIDGHEVIAVEQSGGREDFLADQTIDQGRHDVLELLWIDRSKHGIEGIAVRNGDPEEVEELLLRGLAAKQKADLSTCPEPGQKHKDAGEGECGNRIGDLAELPWFRDGRKDRGKKHQNNGAT